MKRRTFTLADLERLRKAYEENREADTFLFDGMVLVPRYAAYLIEYLDHMLKGEKND